MQHFKVMIFFIFFHQGCKSLWNSSTPSGTGTGCNNHDFVQSPSKTWQQHERLLRSTRGQPARCRSNGRQICNETHRWTLPTRSSGDRTRASFSRLPSTWHWWVPRNETAAARRRSFCLFTPRTTTVECEPIRSQFLSVIMFSVTVGVIPVAVWVVDVIRKNLSPSLCLSFLENDHHSKKKNCASWSGEVGCFK